MTKMSLGDNVSWNNGSLNCSGSSINDWNDLVYRPSHWVHSYTERIIETKPNKFELAFKIVSKLFEKEIIKELSMKKFIELVDTVADTI